MDLNSGYTSKHSGELLKNPCVQPSPHESIIWEFLRKGEDIHDSNQNPVVKEFTRTERRGTLLEDRLFMNPSNRFSFPADSVAQGDGHARQGKQHYGSAMGAWHLPPNSQENGKVSLFPSEGLKERNGGETGRTEKRVCEHCCLYFP